MTTIAIHDIGYCADFSQQGDWAFDFAFNLASSLDWGLNIFYVPDLAWDAPHPPPRLSSQEVVDLERQVRSYYDERLGDFVEAGFRICEGFADVELRRCMMHRDYQLLVLAYKKFGASFAGRAIEAFAYGFNAPVVLVGPERPDQYFLNPPAMLLRPQLGLTEDEGSVVVPGVGAPAGA
jgi:hypothetical protein